MHDNEDLSKGGKAAASLIAKAAAAFAAGFLAAHAIGGAQAAVPLKLMEDVAELKMNVARIMDRLNIEREPKLPPVHTAGPTR